MTGIFLLASSVFFFLSPNAPRGASAVRPSRTTHASRRVRLRVGPAQASSIVFSIRFMLGMAHYLRVRSLWQVEQNARLLAWSLISRSGCAEAWGWWQVRQLIDVMTFVTFVGSTTSETGWPSTGCPRPNFSGRITTLFLAK